MCALELFQKAVVFVLAILCGLFTADVFAEVLYEDFSSTDGLTLNEMATVGVNEPDGRALWITPAIYDSWGSAFTTDKVNISQFSTSFTFRITPSYGADGLVFVIQSESASAGGSIGGSLGYSGISPSIGVEFDTYYNTEWNDPSGNHVGININGPNHGEDSPYTISVSPDFDDGNLWHVWIDYDGSELTVSASEQTERPDNPLLTRSLDLFSILGGNTAYVGFTAATGAEKANHMITSWSYTAVPEPSTMVLLAAGVVSLLAYVWRRRTR